MDLQLTDSNDLLVKDFDLVLIDGLEAVRQQVLVKLRLWRGEWFLDTEFGTPWLTDILGKQVSLSGVIAALQTSILQVPGTVKFAEFNFDFNRQRRVLTVDFILDTIYGQVEITA